MRDVRQGGVVWLMATIVLTPREFETLPEYSCSLPTGTTVGKQWRRREPYQTGPGVEHTWWRGQYVEHPDPGKVGIEWDEIIMVEPSPHQPCWDA